MARKLILEVTCDACTELDDIEVEANEMVPIAIGNAKPRIVALCKEHQTNFFEPFVNMIQKLGVTPEQLDKGANKVRAVPGPQNQGESFCPIEDCPKHTKPLKSRNVLQAHMRSQHDMTLGEYEAAHGVVTSAPVPAAADEQLPLDGGAPANDWSEYKCTLPSVENKREKCGWTPPETTSRPAQSVSMHKRRVHGIAAGD